MKVAILGAGLTGLSLAARLAENGHTVDLFEKEPKVGGLCKTEIIDGYIYDIHGGHVFNSRYNDVLDWIFGLIHKDKWHYSNRDAMIQYKGNVISYPFELALAELPPEETVECIIDFFQRKGRKPKNFHNWLIWMFGKSIAEKYMIPYNMKIWKHNLHNMAIDWVDGKMPLPTKNEILQAALTKNSAERKMPHSTFYYPMKNGIGEMVDSIIKSSLNVNFFLNYKIDRIRQCGKNWHINELGGYDKIFWTIPLPYVAEILEAPASIVNAAKKLKWNSLTTFIFKSEERSSISWKYFPDLNLPFHRIVYQGNLSPLACPSGKGSFTVEMIGRHEPDELKDYFNLRDLLAHNYTEFAYVLFDKKHSINADTVKQYLIEQGVTPLGRFGEWKYYNMDICMQRAFTCAKSLGH